MISASPSLDLNAGAPAISDKAAYAVVLCVPLVSTFAFFSPNIGDAAIILLVLGSIWLAWRDRSQLLQPPVVLAMAWMAFIAISAAWATWSGTPGDQFRSWHKHVAIALGPIIAIAITAACRRLRWRADWIFALFLAGLVIGAVVLLLRNDAIATLVEVRVGEGTIGGINRNLAALACGLAIIAALTLIGYTLVSPLHGALRALIVVVLTPIMMALLVLTLQLQSRGGYAGTTTGLIVWLLVLAGLAWRRQSGSRARYIWLISAIIAGAAIAFAAYEMLAHGGRATVKVPTANGAELMMQLLHGRFDQAYAVAQAGEERVKLLTFAADLFHRRPWLGWGPDVWQLPRHLSPLPELQPMNQFHNGYAQFLVSFGVIGAALILSYLATLVRSAVRNAAEPSLSPPLFAGALALCAFLVVVNFSETVLMVKCAASTAMMLAAMACLRLSADPPAGRPVGR